MQINIPPTVQTILEQLENCGYEAYVVGGCVRDSLLGRPPQDWDICTSALPDQVSACLSHYTLIPTGLQHGTLTVVAAGQACEITTFRTESGYSDHRRPDAVQHGVSLTADLSRRDFTINALAYHPRRGLQDPYGGLADLRSGLIRCVGSPQQRFAEDALRLLRALRFAASLSFRIETATAAALQAQRQLLHHIAAERIQTELNKLLVGPQAASVLGEYSELCAVFLPEITPAIGYEQHSSYHHLDVWRHTLAALAQAPPHLTVRLTLLFHDLGKPFCRSYDERGLAHYYGHQQRSAALAVQALSRLKYPKQLSRQVEQLIRYHDAELGVHSKPLKRWLHKLGEEQLQLLLAVKRADILAHHPQRLQTRLRRLEASEQTLQKILTERQCFRLADLAVNGHDLLDLGLTEGPQIGRILNRLFEQVLDETLPNERLTLLAAARQLAGQIEA